MFRFHLKKKHPPGRGCEDNSYCDCKACPLPTRPTLKHHKTVETPSTVFDCEDTTFFLMANIDPEQINPELKRVNIRNEGKAVQHRPLGVCQYWLYFEVRGIQRSKLNCECSLDSSWIVR